MSHKKKTPCKIIEAKGQGEAVDLFRLPLSTASTSILLPSPQSIRTFLSVYKIDKYPKERYLDKLLNYATSNNIASFTEQNAYLKGFKKSIHATQNALLSFFKKRDTLAVNGDGPSFLLENRKIAVIGIHGWGPIKILQSVIGNSSTSELYISYLTRALREEFSSKCSISIVEIPLNGHGCINERVDRFYAEIISNAYMRNNLKDATDIFLVAHSQGVPVGVFLLEKLISDNIINTQQQRICMLSMAGIFHGPFPQLGKNFFIQYMETESARELFELHSPLTNHVIDMQQLLASKIRRSLSSILMAGVRIIAIGSWMDQLVPLYSSTLYGLFHPNIVRMVFIEDKHSDTFLPQLISLCLLLKNVGHDDFGLLVYLSEFIAGSIVSGDNGHSSIYSDPLVYESVVKITPMLFDTTVSSNGQLPKYVPFDVPEQLNHYHLPWMMHALLTDTSLRKIPEINERLDLLIDSYSSWHPKPKLLKELKRKLAPIGSLYSRL